MSSRWKRKGGKKFVMLERYEFSSAAWLDLSTVDRAIYILLKQRYDGMNNGTIGLSVRDAAANTNVSKATASRAFNSLIEHGFIVKAKESGFNIKNRVSAEWLLTEYMDDRNSHPPLKYYLRWIGEKKQQSHEKDTQSHDRYCNDKKPP